ncbi:MAG: DNA-binding response regulator [Candidatus Lambdaproteobacteria bacterium RIFOXYD1_FULL_56_27]|uniref:DNA-binding response regulator n=1 Tax=Candidatus Lambdaproteobacteria bacterium RIFOXYD2_FULL_56_26 TaxID=1817773 RepID=A0A1F6GM62_9PROT|nr:MAG: DNA-binding response regulator [Candidatus Lambdaproteobacteria bacterium RIFOXYD2_FULL_56_26]OGH01751.1 MAG: DNA-binding response regulator [Candidatus Lambdaproteobacteria bacterium RIFOXYC1_FULL_56_13]OGH07624.1 MAG: DNA-binding response regulator [Candidatus Lambdaproteobacteria bacterium RIFOXYD1_FULL_56_27]
MNHILVIEDQEDVRELIAYNLRKQGYEVIEANNANDALILLEDINLDLILLDLMLPGLGGLDFLKILKSKEPFQGIAVIILSAKSEEQEVVTGLKLGADDYIPKPFSIKVLLAKIESVLRRVNSQEQSLLRYKDLLLNQEEHKVYALGQEVTLTNKEFELLSLFLKKPKKVFHRNQLLNSIWGYDSETYTRTVDAHVSSLRKKLGEPGKMIRSIPKVGYGLDI